MAPCFVDNWTPLHDACAKGDDEGVQALIDRKADLNAGGHPRQARRCSHTTCGMTPLHVACKTGAEGCVRLLLEANADANRAHAGCQGRGETPLHYATEASHDGCVRLLVEGSADQKANNHGETPLYLACKRQYEGWRDDTPRVLLTAKGCHANAPCTIGPDGWTALHVVCAQYPDVRTAHVLLEGGGDRFARNKDGITPRQTTESKQIRALFDTGVDYWQRLRHAHHSWAMRETVQALLIVELRLNRKLAARRSPRRNYLVHLPEEIWLIVCAFMRSADFDGITQ